MCLSRPLASSCKPIHPGFLGHTLPWGDRADPYATVVVTDKLSPRQPQVAHHSPALHTSYSPSKCSRLTPSGDPRERIPCPPPPLAPIPSHDLAVVLALCLGRGAVDRGAGGAAVGVHVCGTATLPLPRAAAPSHNDRITTERCQESPMTPSLGKRHHESSIAPAI
jgi:hypothetical protein